MHGPGVLQEKTARLPIQGAGYSLNGDIPGGACRWVPSGKHLAQRGSLQRTVKVLVDRHPPARRVRCRLRSGLLGRQLDLKTSRGVHRFSFRGLRKERGGEQSKEEKAFHRRREVYQATTASPYSALTIPPTARKLPKAIRVAPLALPRSRSRKA